MEGRTIPSARIPGAVKLEPPHGSYPSLSGFWNWLRHVRSVTVAHRLSTVVRNSTSSRNFEHVVFLFTLEVCLALSLHKKVPIRLHAHDPTQNTSHSEFKK